MAETITQIQQPPEFIEAASKTYLSDLQKGVGAYKAADLSQVYGPQFTAGLGALSQDAISKAGGLGTYAPYLQTAETRTGPSAYQAFMSPYQTDVIKTSLDEYDRQVAKGVPQLAANAINAGAYGGAREGVAQAEYASDAAKNRAALQANMLQQGYGQAQQLAGQDFNRQISLAQQNQGLAGAQIAGLTTLGGLQQTQAQQGLTAQQQLAQQQMMQPLQAAQQYGAGVTQLIAGYPGQTNQTIQPTPSMAQTALGAGATLAGIYRAFRPQNN
jgi:hypothetical protein